MRFSEREGYTSVSAVLQIEGMGQSLRNRLWNQIVSNYEMESMAHSTASLSRFQFADPFCKSIWGNHLKRPIDELDRRADRAYYQIKESFFNVAWHGVYDFIEFVVSDYHLRYVPLVKKVNSVLEQERSGWRLVGKHFVRITSPIEIEAVEEALQRTGSLSAVSSHLTRAVELLGDRESPDYRNSIKESISAVEAISKRIGGDKSGSLGKALNQIEREGSIQLHPSLKSALTKLYGYTSDASGIRHALLDEPSHDVEDGTFMLIACSAFVNYLKVKASKAGLDL